MATPSLSSLHGDVVDRALGHAAVTGRFADGDLASIIAHQAFRHGRRLRASEGASLQRERPPGRGSASEPTDRQLR